jgi:hypothetical protein
MNLPAQEKLGGTLAGMGRRMGESDRIILSNFLFYSSYTVIFLHPFFYFHDEGLAVAIVLGMAIFGSLQVGGFFFLESIARKYSASLEVMLSMRIAATVLLAIPRAGCIVIGFALLGLSHSIFFVNSRTLLGKFRHDGNAFFKLSLSTNLAYFLMPGVGALIISAWSMPYLGLVLSLMFSGSAYGILKQAQDGAGAYSASDEAGGEERKSIVTLVKDCVLFALFVLPYTTMMSLVSIKTYLFGYDATWNSMLFGANSLVAITMLFTYISLNLKSDSMRTYFIVSLVASALCIAAMSSGYLAFVAIFVAWSVCETYQGPAIERHVFSAQKYPKSQLKWIVGVDGICSFIGPVLAGNAFFAPWLS